MDAVNKLPPIKSTDIYKIAAENIRSGNETLCNLIIEVVTAPLQLWTVPDTLKLSLFKWNVVQWQQCVWIIQSFDLVPYGFQTHRYVVIIS